MKIEILGAVPKPKLQPYKFGTKKVINLERYTLEFKLNGVWKIITVPAGFICDGSSLPIGLIFGKFDPDTWAAFLIHDFLFATGQFNQEVADILYKKLLIVGKIKAWKAHTVFRTLRIVGWIPYCNHRKAEKKQFSDHAEGHGLDVSGPRQYACFQRAS